MKYKSESDTAAHRHHFFFSVSYNTFFKILTDRQEVLKENKCCRLMYKHQGSSFSGVEKMIC